MNRNSHIPRLKQEISKRKQHTTEKPPTLSYTQLKVEVSALQEENADLRQKLMKHQNSVLSSKAAMKDLQKENKELKQRLDEETRQLKDLLSASQDELSTKTSFLETKLQSCEEALEHSGINPVTLASLEMDQEQRRKDFTEATVSNVNPFYARRLWTVCARL
ncbi:uncharacterized protein [Diadema setosum]|uniref:uncharacterized protein n=1 Tax=Diadema setosum TaxID=31175 RepID=UPI003B3BBA0A